jgi:hypothetical protein
MYFEDKGGEHNERCWRERAWRALVFLFGSGKPGNSWSARRSTAREKKFFSVFPHKGVDTLWGIVCRMWGVVGNGGFQGGTTTPKMVKALTRTVFFGTFRHTVDEKNRVAIPAKWRAGRERLARSFTCCPIQRIVWSC